MADIPDILESTEHVAAGAAQVRIDQQAVQDWADAHRGHQFLEPSMPPELHFEGSRDECANLALLLSCLNFCFWSPRPWSVTFRGKTWNRTHAMVASILRAVEDDRSWLTAQRWADADEPELVGVFAGRGQIPLARQRRMVLNETGLCLSTAYRGLFGELVSRVAADAHRLAHELASGFPSFRDVARYGDRSVAFLKRAQLCAAEVHRLWRANGHGAVDGLDALTLFADYRLPQYLRHAGILELRPELAARIDRGQEIAAGAPEEVELRSATVSAGERIRRALNGRVPAWRLDFMLWRQSHAPEVTVAHHRTTTIYY